MRIAIVTFVVGALLGVAATVGVQRVQHNYSNQAEAALMRWANDPPPEPADDGLSPNLGPTVAPHSQERATACARRSSHVYECSVALAASLCERTAAVQSSASGSRP